MVLARNEIIRFAVDTDVSLLAEQVYVSAPVLRWKVEFGEFVVAVSGAELLGFVQLEYLWSKVPYIALIRVLPDHRRRGLGKSMLRFVESFLYEREHRVIYSSSQADEPEPQEWHLHVGFKECGIIREINDGIDEVFFCKTLAKA